MLHFKNGEEKSERKQYWNYLTRSGRLATLCLLAFFFSTQPASAAGGGEGKKKERKGGKKRGRERATCSETWLRRKLDGAKATSPPLRTAPLVSRTEKEKGKRRKKKEGTRSVA